MAVRRALLSVSDKTGIEELGRALAEMGVEILSTGGTARALAGAGVPIRGVSDVTRFPEMLDGRVKTLHPAIHGGILARRDSAEHMSVLKAHGIGPIDLVCVNLYPFARAIANPDVTPEDAIENIDIGGPAMVRSAAKNHDFVAVVVDPADYAAVLDELRANRGCTTLPARRRLAARAFAHTARYDSMVAAYFSERLAPGESFPPELTLGFARAQECRYGENPHQMAAFYRSPEAHEPSVSTARQIHGKELSFNNISDIDAALELVKELEEGPAAVVVKHANPCGAAVGGTLAEAFGRARAGDPVSAFGGILALNRPVDAATADAITGRNMFFEAVIAPGFQSDALPILTARKKWGANLRLLEVGPLEGWRALASGRDARTVVGGLLVQDRDLRDVTREELRVATERAPTEEEMARLLFAWRVVRHVKSNAIVLARRLRLVGVGAGQMNRVQSVRIAVEHARDEARGSVLASDAFFPFPDGPRVAIEAGVTAMIQPGGSVKDAETIEVCNQAGVAMVFTGLRHFRH
ncbi:MAG: bifunctional phosphoribosylaminoimidazolecarboxamide formyltransferase/IMP cyclohydrolase [Chthonomonadales bacterium]|nr:bifunctional phosphoribosylaminoimidazolecarboxamide formyltransferase/IMP cyclohydrolase [Chthonomonadales bacterium]